MRILLGVLVGALVIWPAAQALIADCQTVSAGAETDDPTGSLQNAGQTAIGRTTDGTVHLHAGIIPCLAMSMCVHVAPDLDNDCDVDVADWGLFQGCALGPAIHHNGTTTCAQADFDSDGDVDTADSGVFQVCYSGAGNQPDAHCAD